MCCYLGCCACFFYVISTDASCYVTGMPPKDCWGFSWETHAVDADVPLRCKLQSIAALYGPQVCNQFCPESSRSAEPCDTMCDVNVTGVTRPGSGSSAPLVLGARSPAYIRRHAGLCIFHPSLILSAVSSLVSHIRPFFEFSRPFFDSNMVSRSFPSDAHCGPFHVDRVTAATAAVLVVVTVAATEAGAEAEAATAVTLAEAAGVTTGWAIWATVFVLSTGAHTSSLLSRRTST